MKASAIDHFNPSRFHRLLGEHHRTGIHKLMPKPNEKPQAADSFTSKAADTASLLVHQAYSERTQISAQYTELAARAAGGDGDEATELAVRQLNFEFLHEVRAEQVAIFNQRTGQVAKQLEGPQQASYLETSQRVAARFSASLNVSVSVLQGYAGASEAASDGSGDFIDKLIAFTNKLLERVDDVLNEAFELLGSFTGEKNGFDLGAKLNETIRQLESFFTDFFRSGAGGTPSGTQKIGAFGLQLEFSFNLEIQVEGVVQQSDPITLDLDGDGIELTSHTNGARFDILGNGRAVNTAFVTGGDAFLALDRNGNGIIDSGRELFGDQNGAANGFEELRMLDSNRDGVVDANDEAFDQLLLFRDNGNGITEPGELISLRDAGIEAILLGYRDVIEAAAGGNRIAQAASYRRVDGTYGRAVDSILNYTV